MPRDTVIHSRAIAFDSRLQGADTVDIPLRQRHRIVFATGVMATAADSRRYDRINRQVIRDGVAKDSAFSTFDAASGNGVDLVNPALMANVSLSDLVPGTDLCLTAGTTMRTVNAQRSLEPLVGIAFGILDRFFLQIGAHFGREEVLKIQPIGPVPISVTRSDAVGTDWVTAFRAGFALRVN